MRRTSARTAGARVRGGHRTPIIIRPMSDIRDSRVDDYIAALPDWQRRLKRGHALLNGESIRTGDAASITGAVELDLSSEIAAELILIDVPLEFEPVGVWAGER
jgi:quercetinase-like protein